MRFQVVLEGQVRPTGTPDGLEKQLDSVMTELARVGAGDPAIGGVLSRGEVEISISVEASTPQEAVHIGSSAIRSAIHASGTGTAGWSVDWITAHASRIHVPERAAP